MTMHTDPYSGRPLVPPADREFIPSHELETAQETIWFNPTDKPVVLKLYIGVTPCRSQAAKRQFRSMSPMQQREFRTGIRTFIIPPGSRRSLHSDFDMGVQQYVCLEQECVNNKLYCRDRTHHKMVVGGYGPQLVNESVQHRPQVHPSLNEAAALEKASREAAEQLLRERDLANQRATLAYAQMEEARIRQERAAADEAAGRARADAEQRAAAEARAAQQPPAAQPAPAPQTKKKD